MTDILMRIWNIVERVRQMGELSDMATIGFGILFAFGLLNCILGYRLLRFWMLLFGFFTGAGVGFGVLYSSDVTDRTLYLTVMVISGIVLALVAFLIYRVGIFVLGASIGMTLSIYILHPTTSAMFFVCILIGIGLGAVGMKYAREVIIVATSLFGGTMAGLSLAKIGGMNQIPFGILLSLGFALLGMLIQFAINRSSDDEDDDDDEEDEEENETEFRSLKTGMREEEIDLDELERLIEEGFELDEHREQRKKSERRYDHGKRS